MDCERLFQRKARETRPLARLDEADPGCRQPRTGALHRSRDRRAHLAGNVGEDLRRSDARQLGEQFVVRVLARDCGRCRIGRRNVGVCDRKGLARQRDRREIVVLLAVEQLLFDQRSWRHQADDVAPYQPVRLRHLELLGERDDEALLHELCQVAAQGVMRYARHRHALAAAGLFAGERDLQRARDRLCVFAVGFVEVADAREQDRFRMPRFHPEVLLEHRRILDQRRCLFATPSPPDRATEASRAARDRSSAPRVRRFSPRIPRRARFRPRRRATAFRRTDSPPALGRRS